MTNIYFESVLMAWSSIVSHKMRSLLTMLGIIIGVAAVIALMSIGYGVQDSIKSDISRLGSNTITVTPGPESTEPPFSLGYETTRISDPSSEEEKLAPRSACSP